jgi:hypothetical protein
MLKLLKKFNGPIVRKCMIIHKCNFLQWRTLYSMNANVIFLDATIYCSENLSK